MAFDISSASRTGSRSENEDYTDFLELEGATCWLLADGLGGHRGGATASRTAVEAAIASFRENPAVSADAITTHVARAQRALLAAQEADPALSQMRSTIVVLVSNATEATWAHVGDSRLYHLRGGRVAGRTRDHSVVQALVDAGNIPPSQQGYHEDRGRLTRSLGKGGDVTPAVQAPAPLCRGDAFLLCSDGFWEAIDETAMEVDAAGSATAAAWLERMEARVRRSAGGSKDNYTATAVRLINDNAPLPPANDPTSPPAAMTDLPEATTVKVVSSPAARVQRSMVAVIVGALVLALIAGVGIWQRARLREWLFPPAPAKTTAPTAAPASDKPAASGKRPSEVTKEPTVAKPSTPARPSNPAAETPVPTTPARPDANAPTPPGMAAPESTASPAPREDESAKTPPTTSPAADAKGHAAESPAGLAEGTVFRPKTKEHFPRLEDAVAKVGNRETIWIGPGRFTPKLDPLKKSITFKGAGRDRTILDFSGHAGLILNGQSGGVVDLTLCCATDVVLELGPAFKGVVERSRVRDGHGWGIIIRRGANAKIVDTPATGNKRGDVSVDAGADAKAKP